MSIADCCGTTRGCTITAGAEATTWYRGGAVAVSLSVATHTCHPDWISAYCDFGMKVDFAGLTI